MSQEDLLEDANEDESIIKINLPRFEGYLQSIKAQLVNHEIRLDTPRWLDDIKVETERINILTRKMEHSLLDINTLKDFVYSRDDSKLGKKDPLLFLQGEVENLKMITRRIELYQAEDLNIFQQLKLLQRHYSDMIIKIQLLDKTNEIKEMRAEFASQVDSLNQQIKAAGADVVVNLGAISQKIEDTAATLQEETHSRLKDIQNQIDSFLSDGEEEQDEDASEIVDQFDETADSAAILRPSQMVQNRGVITAGTAPTTTDASIVTASNTEDNDNQGSNNSGGESNDAGSGKSSRNTVRITTVASSSADNNTNNSGSSSRSTKRNISLNPASSSTTGVNNAISAAVTASSTGRMSVRPSVRNAGGGKFLTVERFLTFQDEVSDVTSHLNRAVDRLQYYGCAKIYRMFSSALLSYDMVLKRKGFDKFRQHNDFISSLRLIRRRKQATHFNFLVFTLWRRRQIAIAYDKWCFAVQRLQEGERLKNYVASIGKYWYERARPDLKKYLNVWKNFTVESFRSSLYVGVSDVEQAPYDEFAHQLNGNFNMKEMKKIAHKDLQRRMSMRPVAPAVEYVKDSAAEELLRQEVAGLHVRVAESEAEVAGLRKEVMRLFAMLEQQKSEVTARIDTESGRIVGTINNFKSKVTTQLSLAQEKAEQNSALVEENFTRRDEAIRGVDERVAVMEKDLQFHRDTQSSISASQRQIRAEMDDVLVKQQYIDSKFKLMSNELVLNGKAMAVGVEEVRRVEKGYQDVTTFYDAELRGMKANASALGEQIQDMTRKNKKNAESLTAKLKELEDNQELVFPKKPLPSDLHALCSRYETLSVRLHGEGGVSAFNQGVEKELVAISARLAVEATRIAYYVVTTADKRVVDRLVEHAVVSLNKPANFALTDKRLRPASANNTGGNDKSDSNNNAIGNSNGKAPQSLAAQIQQERDTLLQEFLGKFVALLAKKDAQLAPNPIRSRARVLFHSKLKVAVDVLISKHSFMHNAQDSASALTRRPYQELPQQTAGGERDSCVACSRPFSANNRSSNFPLPIGSGTKQRPLSAQIASKQVTATMSTTGQQLQRFFNEANFAEPDPDYLGEEEGDGDFREAARHWQLQQQMQQAHHFSTQQGPETTEQGFEQPQRTLSPPTVTISYPPSPTAADRVPTSIPLDFADLHLYLNKPDQQRVSSATRHRDALKQSHTMQQQQQQSDWGVSGTTKSMPNDLNLVAHGAGFRAPAAAILTAQEELAQSLASSFRKDVTIPNINLNRPGQAAEEGDNQAQLSRLLAQSQSDNNLLGGRRLVGVPRVSNNGSMYM